MEIIRRTNTRRRRIAAIGMYDGVHVGHRFLIDFVRDEAARRRLTPSVVTFSEHPLNVVAPLRAPGLLTTFDQRMEMLEADGVADCVVLQFNDKLRRMSAREFLKNLKDKYAVDALVVGFNNRFGRDVTDGLDEYRRIGKEIGMEIIGAPEYKGKGSPVSSSIIRRYLSEGNIKKTNESLGRVFTMVGRVTSGKGIGRRMGFPTANLVPLIPQLLIPRTGVYSVVVTTPDGTRRPGMLNIGFRPTIETGPAEMSIEVNILDYAGYLYDEVLTVEFVERLRNEKRFADTGKLSAQLASDARRARRSAAKYLKESTT